MLLGEEIFLLFPQKMRGFGFIMNQEKSGPIREISGRNRWPRCLSSTSRKDSRCLLRLSNLTGYSSKDFIIILNFLQVPIRLSVPPTSQKQPGILRPHSQQMDYGYFPFFFKRGKWCGRIICILSIMYFNKTLIGQAGSIGRLTRQEVEVGQ